MNLPAALGVLAAFTCTAAMFATRRREALGGADEGYLWYGVQRLRAGEQPLRDFRSYEPGRYWLCALVARVRGGDGVVGNRLAGHLVIGGALVAVEVAAGTAGAPWHGLLALPVLVLSWERTQFRLFDVSALLLVVAGGIWALGGSAFGHVALGAAVALAACMGLNLALYSGVAAVVLLAVGAAAGTTTPADVLAAVAGGGLGLVPLLCWWGLAHGTWGAMVAARVRTPAARGSTNLPLPIPWPWRPSVAVMGTRTSHIAWAVRLALGVLPPLAALAGAWLVATGGELRVVLPLAAVGVTSSHHALSRADLDHVGRVAGIQSGALAMLPGALGLASSVVLTLVALVVLHEVHPRLMRLRRPKGFRWRQVGPEGLWLHRPLAAQLDAVVQALRPGEALAAVPFGIPLVAAAGRRSPVRDTYCVYPADAAADEAMRAELEAAAPVLVLVDAAHLDADPFRAFPVTHPGTYAWLCEHSEVVETGSIKGLPPTVTLLRVDAR